MEQQAVEEMSFIQEDLQEESKVDVPLQQITLPSLN